MQTAAVIVQSPNFFGIVEDAEAAAELAHRRERCSSMFFTEAVVAGDSASRRGMPISWRANCNRLPSHRATAARSAGIIATKEKFMRQMPGRLVGETHDSRAIAAFCLTLATREQHIRREKATSNICTNQALIALMATVFMTVYGKQGLRELAEQNLAKAHYLAGKLQAALHGTVFQRIRRLGE